MRLRYFYVLLGLLIIPFARLAAQSVQLTVKVIISPKIAKTDSLVITGNQPAFGNWFDFTKGRMKKADDTTWMLTATFPVNTSLEFKVNRGSYYKDAIYTYGKYQTPKMPFVIKKDTTVTLRPS